MWFSYHHDIFWYLYHRQNDHESDDFSPADVYFPTQTVKQDKIPYISPLPTLQVGRAVTHVDSDGNWVTATITNVMICTISGDPMYLLEGSPNQTHQANIDSIREPWNTEMFFINITVWYLHTSTAPNTPLITIYFRTHCHTPSTTTV